jgi:hypothetical protein
MRINLAVNTLSQVVAVEMEENKNERRCQIAHVPLFTSSVLSLDTGRVHLLSRRYEMISYNLFAM